MIKKRNGFALVETLIVSTIISSILIYMFVQFNSLQNRYNETLRYNDVDDLYKLSEIKSYIVSLSNSDKQNIKNLLESDSLIIINKEGNSYNNLGYIDNQESMLNDLNIKSLIITYADLNNINSNQLSQNVVKMLKRVKNKSDNYRIIVEFNNNNLATITFDMEVL